MATEAGSTTKPPAAQTPLSAAPRRSCRARRVNSRFDNDEVDESFRQLVARIAAPDSHSILQSPQLAFHCPNPTPPPPPQPPAPPVPSPVQQRADLTAPSSNISKKGVNQSTTGSSGNKKKGTIVLKKSVSKKSCKDSESANKDKKKKTSQVQGKSVKKSKSTLLQSKKSLAFDSSSEDEVPLAKFASRSVTSSGLASDDDLPLAELVPKKDTSDSYSCGLPGNYSIKTIHNPDLSNTPISIVCIEDPDETRPIQVKKVKRKSFSKMFNLSKKSKLALPHGHKKDNDSLSESSESKTVHKNSLDHKKSKHKMSMQPTQGKLLKIVNLKVVPNSLCDFSNNNPLRKFIENKTSSPTFSEKSEEDGLTLATLSDQSERIVSPSSMCLQSENITEKSSQNDIYGKYGAGKSSQFDSETELCQVQNKCSDDVKCDTTLAVSDCSDSSRKAAERVAQVLSGSGSLPKLSASNKQEESILNLTFNETKEGFSNSESNDCISVSKGKRKLEDLGKDNYSLKSNTRLGSNTPAKLNKDKLKSNGAEYVKSLSTDEKDPHTKINLSAVNNFLPSNGSSPFVPLIQDVTASHASKTLDKSSLSNSSSYSFENSSSFGTPVVSTPKIKLNVSSSEKSSILFPLESASKLTTTSSEDWSTTHSKTSSEKSSPESKFCSDQHHKFSSSSKNHLKSSRPSLSKSSVAKVELRDSIAEKDVCLTGHNLKESRKSQDMDNQFYLHSNENMSNIKDTKIFNKESNKHYKRRTDDPTTSGNKKVKHENEDSCSKTKSTSVKYTLGNVLLYSQSNHVTTNATIKSERDKSDNKISKTNKADVSRLPEGDSVGLSSVKHLKCEPYEEKPDIAMIRDTNEQLEVEVKNKGFLHVEKRLDDKYLSLVKSEITHKEKSIEQHGDGQLSHERAKVKSVASSPSAKKLPEVSNASTNLCENKSDHCKAKQNHSLSSHSLSNLPEVKTDYEKIKEKVVSSPENIKNSHGDKTAHDKKDKALLSLNNTRNLAENKTDRNLDKNSDLSKAIPTSETVDSKADIKPSLLITKIIEGTGDDKQYSLKSGDCLTLAKETNTSSVNNENISTYNDTLSSHKTVSQGGAHFHTSMKKEPEDVYENCRVSPTSDVKAVFCSTSTCDEGELVSGDPSRSREKGSSSNRHKEASHHKSSGKHKHSSKERHRRFDSSSKSSTSSSYKSSSQKKSDSHSDCDKHEKVHSDEKHRRRDSSKSSHKDRDKNERDKVSKSTVIKSDEKVSNKAVLTSAKLEEPTRSSVVNVYEPPAKEASITSVKEDLLTTFVNTSESSASPTLSTILDENGKCVSPVIELLNMCRANIPKNDPEVDKNVVENSLSISFPAAVFVPPHQNKKVALDSVEYKCLVTENKTQVGDHSLSLEEATSTSLCLPSNKSSSVKCENDTDSQPNLESPRIISVNNREKSVKRSRETDSSDSDVSNESDYGNSKVSSKSRKQKSTSSPEFSLKSTKSKPIKRDIISDLPAEVNDDKADSEKLFGEFSLNDKPVTKVGNSINVPLVPAPIDNLPESCPALPADIKPPPLGTPESVSRAPVIETPEERMLREVAEAESAAERERRNETIVEQRMKAFEHLTENFYLIERKKSKQSKEVRRMVCDCTLTKEELLRGEKGCGDDCLNRLLMIECGWRCPLGTSCINRNFQSGLCAPVKVFNAEQKGCGVVATEEIPPGTFIMEYVGEVFDQREFRRRRKEYGRDGTAHFYFMALKADQFIDATRKGNISRFVNHSCDPNAETQKWTVNGELRVGFFSTKTIKPGEEINFDYRMERYGREPQKCYCGTAVCRGWLGEPPDEKTKEEKEEERRRASSTAPDRRKKEDKKQYDDELQDDLCELQRAGLRNRQDTLLLSRVMVRAESEHTRTQLLLLLRAAHTNTPCLRLFLDYHGLSLLWSWMADLDSAMLHAPLKLQILKTLDILPITNRTQVTDSRVLEVVEKWSKQTPEPASAVTTVTPPTGTPASVESSLEDSTKKTSDTSEDSDDVVTDECSLDSMDAKGVSSKAQQQQSPDDNSSSSDSMSGAKTSSKESLVSGVLQQPSRETTPEQHPAALSSQEEFRNVQLEVVSLAGELLARWQVLKEEFRIPKKQRVQLMREHERQVDADYRRYLDTERGRREMMERSYSGTRRDSYQDRYRSRMPVLDKDGRRCWQVPQLCDDAMLMNGDEFAGLSKEERREKFAQKVAIQDEQRRVQESMWSVHVERCVRSGLDPYLAPIVDPSGNYYWDAGNSAWVPLTPQTAFAASVLNPALAQEQQAARLGYNSVAEMEAAYANPHAIPIANGEVIPPVVVTISLPPHWHIARDQHNRLYFYHSRSRQTQWDIPTLETKTTLQYEMDSESDSESSSSSDSEEFSSDEGNGNEDEAASSAAGETADDEPETVEGKIIRRQRGKKKHSEALVQQRVISPIREMDRELARKERREAKERARHEARKERLLLQNSSADAKEDDGDDEEKTDDIIVKMPHKPREKLKVKSKERAATAIADTSEKARKLKDLFRSRMATFIVSVLNPYRRADCRQGRINTTEDFKYLARKLTHFVMVKELKQLPSIESLDCNDSVKHKTKDFVRKYMAKYGSSFKRDPLDTKEY